ncbi:MAG: C45 family autoproteolytic acyltransferase/hydrolase, partial [Phycisphaerales bacterium]
VRALAEEAPGGALAPVLGEYWPAYRKWIGRAMEDPHTDAARGDAMLRAHMPEIVPIYEAFRGMAGGDAHAAKFFSLWKPPPVVRGCSQAIWTDGAASALIRNYDHAPHLSDGIVLWSGWGGVRTVCVTDCLWGALDGVNEHGLCVALAFGGRQVVGEGFAASLVVRYLLQTCVTVREAARALSRVPVFMAYTFVLLDAHGEFVTAYAAPDRPTAFEPARATANHQQRVEWPEYCRFVESVRRVDAIGTALAERGVTRDEVIGRFRRPPIRRYDFERGSGTIYTAAYDPKARALEMLWPEERRSYSVDAFEAEEFEVALPRE